MSLKRVLPVITLAAALVAGVAFLWSLKAPGRDDSFVRRCRAIMVGMSEAQVFDILRGYPSTTKEELIDPSRFNTAWPKSSVLTITFTDTLDPSEGDFIFRVYLDEQYHVAGTDGVALVR